MKPMQNKTPDERKAIAAKGLATRRRNIAEREELMRSAKVHRNGLLEEIDALEKKLAQLRRAELISCTAAKLTGKSLLQEGQIVSSALPWANVVGVYFLICSGRVVYVGQSVNVFGRISQHTGKDFDSYAFVPCAKDALDTLESLYIHCLQPPLNGALPNGAKHAPIELGSLRLKVAA